MISTRSVELVIDTVVCLTLAKWETVSGQFGGYLNWLLGAYLEGVPESAHSFRGESKRTLEQCGWITADGARGLSEELEIAARREQPGAVEGRSTVGHRTRGLVVRQCGSRSA